MHCRYVLIYIALTLAFNEIVKRLLIASMHFNENYGRAQAITKTGAERIRIVYPKQKQGDFTPKIVPVAKAYSKTVVLACIANALYIFVYRLHR